MSALTILRAASRDVLADHRQKATAWAAGTLAARGATLHPVSGGAWDVELADGSWRAANDWRELCVIARCGVPA